MKLLKTLLNEFDLGEIKPQVEKPVSTDDNGIAMASKVQDSIEKEAKLDEIDTITFGLETEDGEVVKVYVNAEYADEVEAELGSRLGVEDSIEDVLNDIAKLFSNKVGDDKSVIVDVEWPGEEDEDDELEGSESLNQEVENAGEESGEGDDDEQTKTNEETTMTTYGERFTKRVLEATEQKQINVSQTKAGADVSFVLEQLGVPIVQDTFVPGIKMKLSKTVRTFDGTTKTAIATFRRTIERLDGGEQQVQESYDGEFVFEDQNREEQISSKLRLQSEKNIFNAVRFLILGAAPAEFVSDLIKPAAILDVVEQIKTSKFKSGQYRNALKVFLAHVNGGNAVPEKGAKPVVAEAKASFNRDEQDTEAGFRENDSYAKIAKMDPALNMVLEVLMYFGFSDRILNHSDLKRELTVDVRRKMRKILVSSDGRRLKMMFGWDGKPGLLSLTKIATEAPKKEAIKEERWSDQSSDTTDDKDAEIADKFDAASDSSDKDLDAFKTVSWEVKSSDGSLVLSNEEFEMTLDDDQSEKLIDDLGAGKKAIVVKTTDGKKYVFTTVAGSAGDYSVSEKGSKEKFLMTSADLDKLSK